ncbi:MAG: metallophosphoesterase family protein [Spirochaetes bacterium]|nr:metallophosphoesterase family protein [Spirochaetota bacterium]
MTLTVLADIHGDEVCIEETADLIKKSDALVIAGDITAKGHRDEVERIIETAEKYTKNILAVHGNMDREDVRLFLEEKNYSLHGIGKMYKGVGFFGVGGSNITPIRTRCNYTEEEIAAVLEQGYKKIQVAQSKVLVSHVPPKGVCDRTFLFTHGGSTAVRDFILSHQDVGLCLCGHVHEAHGLNFLNHARVLNVGSVKRGRFAHIELSRDVITVSERRLV